ncbi:MAG: 3,4-dihydroxy-2-butanone-4-phosphate synthase [Saprospiraceae bacterium]|nr:3,4-dihydroxy-2-butanone-4-phosphate synthase [Saprospiraceae bacterium]
MYSNPTTLSDNEVVLNTIPEAIEDIKKGKVIIVVDDEDRENEGDFICAAETITPEIVNFMALHGRGLICAPIQEERAKELGLDLMVKENTALHHTAFTVSIDLIGHGCTTGISAYDRATGIKAITNPDIKAEDFARPGHIFPLISKKGGVLRRTGHTEASIDLAVMAGLYPAGVLIEILNEDGTMARLPQLLEIAKKFNLKIISIKDLVAYRMAHERIIKMEYKSTIETAHGPFDVSVFRQLTTGDLHLAFSMGQFNESEPALVRVHSSTETGDIFNHILDCDNNSVAKSLHLIAKEGSGLLLYMRHGEKNESIIHKLKALEQGVKEEPSPNMDEQRDFGIGAQILRDFGIRKMRLISNHSKKRVGLIGYGLEITEYVELH